MDKITIERETLERAIAYLEAPTAKLWPAGTLHGIAASLRAALAAQPDDNEWRTAIEDELICAHIGTADSFSDAQSALKSLIDWHVSVSLDPAVSSDAQALIDRGRAAQPADAAVPPEGGIVVSKNEAGQIVCVSRQDEDGQFLSIIAESADAVPPGMALVPIEPTPGIITTGTVALMKASDSDLDATREEIAATYRAMIAAAGDKQ